MPIDDTMRREILSMSRTAHALTEAADQHDTSVRGQAGWAEKQSMLLADMALHLLQTSLQQGGPSPAGLKKNLFSILTIADQFIDGHDLKAVAHQLYST